MTDPSRSERRRSARSLSGKIIALALGSSLAGACDRGEKAAAASRKEAHRSSAASNAPSTTPSSVRLATWNLEWLSAENRGGPARRREQDYARLRKYAEGLNADVIALQEVANEAAAARVFPPDRYGVTVARHGGSQRTGFAYKRGFKVIRNSDFVQLDVGGLRAGTDITLSAGTFEMRLLSVHLKSGCFDQPLTQKGKACAKLRRQVAVLESWIDARSNERAPFAILGDFNRRFFARAGEPFWSEIDDGDPPESDLWSPTDGRTARCWNGEYPDFIDHLVLSRSATRLVDQGSFTEHIYAASDAPFKNVLSRHCPLSVTLRTAPGSDAEPSPAPQKSPEASAAGAPAQGTPPIKGNITRDGRKLYHLPSCSSYAGTTIDPSKGERWFQTEAAAIEAGWVKSGSCG